LISPLDCIACSMLSRMVLLKLEFASITKLIKCCHFLSPLTDTHPSAIWCS
jgi:hypothetical protein